jgi:hypothetical protein
LKTSPLFSNATIYSFDTLCLCIFVEKIKYDHIIYENCELFLEKSLHKDGSEAWMPFSWCW